MQARCPRFKCRCSPSGTPLAVLGAPPCPAKRSESAWLRLSPAAAAAAALAGAAAVQQAAWSNATCSAPAAADNSQECDPARSPRIKVL